MDVSDTGFDELNRPTFIGVSVDKLHSPSTLKVRAVTNCWKTIS